MATTSKKIVSAVDVANPIHKGYLFKQGHSRKSFNKRFFVLYPKLLVYYEHEHDYLRDVERGTLLHRDKGFRLEGLYLSKPDHKPIGVKFCFILHCPNKLNDRKEILLVTENREERRKWMDILQGENPYLREHGKPGATSKKQEQNHHKPSSTLEVPQQWIRADSIVDVSSSGDETQSFEVREGSSDTEM